MPHLLSRPDEGYIVYIVTSPLSAFHPGTLYYGTFYKYCVLVFYGIYFFLGLIFGKFSSLGDFIAEYAIDPSNFYLISRYFTALIGTATVYIVFLVTKMLYKKEIALTAAFFLGMSFLHVRDSHFGIMDVAATFLVMCSYIFIFRSGETRKVKDYFFAGLFAGLAASTKYLGVLLVLPLFISHQFVIGEEGAKFSKRLIDKRLMFFIFSFIVFFIAASPHFIRDYSFILSFLSSQGRYLEEQRHINLGYGWIYHAKVSLFYGAGWTLLISAIVGALSFLRRTPKKALVLLIFPAVYYFLVGGSHVVITRYMVPLIPFVCITGAIFVPGLGSRLFNNKKGPAKGFFTILLALIIISPSAYSLLRFDKLLATKDNRLIAAEWAQDNMPQGSTVYQSGTKFGNLYIWEDLGRLEAEHEKVIASGGKGRVSGARVEYQKRRNIIGYKQWEYDAGKKKFTYNDEEVQGLPDYIIIEESPLLLYSATSEGVREILRRNYTLLEEFKALDMNEKGNVYDQQDAFYMPFSGFRGVVRPGPNIYIYERIHER